MNFPGPADTMACKFHHCHQGAAYVYSQKRGNGKMKLMNKCWDDRLGKTTTGMEDLIVASLGVHYPGLRGWVFAGHHMRIHETSPKRQSLWDTCRNRLCTLKVNQVPSVLATWREAHTHCWSHWLSCFSTSKNHTHPHRSSPAVPQKPLQDVRGPGRAEDRPLDRAVLEDAAVDFLRPQPLLHPLLDTVSFGEAN